MWTKAEQLVPQQAYPYIESKTSHWGRNHARITNIPHNRSNLARSRALAASDCLASRSIEFTAGFGLW